MSTDTLLMIPGPTNLPIEVQRAIGSPSMYHRGPEFAELLRHCNDGLKTVFQTENDVLILACSGTGGDEAALANLVSPDDRVLAINSGKFGKRMGDIAATYGALVTWLEVPAGKAAEPQQVAEMLAHRPFKALLFVQNETSTGVCQNVASLARIAQDYRCLTIVDCVSGMGGIPVKTDAWGLDAVVAGSQKAFMLPPGLAFVSLSERAWQVAEHCRTPRFYFDLRKARASLAKDQTPYTPAVNLMQGLRAALDLMLAEGMEAVYARHARAGRAARAAMTALELELFADPAYASNVVTSVTSPTGLDSSQLVKGVQAGYNIVISGGQDELKGKIFRLGHMGTVQPEDVLRTVKAVGEVLVKLGHSCDPAVAVQAAQDVFSS
jgi:aspartate aminotransferase-like enzyme